MSTKKPSSPKAQTLNEARTCAVPGCWRPPFTRGHCQTHHKQLATTGALAPIRAYRKRSSGTRKFAGLRLSPACIEHIEQKAEREGLSNGAVIAAILEAWVQAGAGRPSR